MPGDVWENRSFSLGAEQDLICYSSYQRELNRLYVIASPILKYLFINWSTSRNEGRSPESPHLDLMYQTQIRLEEWRAALPRHLAFDFDHDISLNATAAVKAHRLQALSLQLTFDHLILFSHRPLLAKQVQDLSRKERREHVSPSQPAPFDTSPTRSAEQVMSDRISSSPAEWWRAALRTSRVTQLPLVAQLATDGHLVAFLGINLLNAAIVLIVCALTDPLSDNAQEAKRNITRIARLQEALAQRSQLAFQSSTVLRSMIAMVLEREGEAMLASVRPVHDRGEVSGCSPQQTPPFSVEDALRRPLTLFEDRTGHEAAALGAGQYVDEGRRLNDSLESVHKGQFRPPRSYCRAV